MCVLYSEYFAANFMWNPKSLALAMGNVVCGCGVSGRKTIGL